MIMGDLYQQEIEYRQKKLPQRYDYGRLTRMFTIGLGFGPLNHYFFVWLGKAMPARNLATLTKKILIDQFVMSPICIAAFFYSMGALESKPIKECNKELKNKFVTVYVLDWLVWTPTQLINFCYVPLKYQAFYTNFISMLYNVFLSYIKHRETAEENAYKLKLDKGQS
ncbi:mpv17-like protein 2 [Anoplophora glabripennis]|uniref:mpv17-like protein 2 n=1 Tax=Anoplophora glabripennis TaxID=217634 RepID=UPI0008759A90|nr:mpv17-like protein 2 [Anoplophora glabripennis]